MEHATEADSKYLERPLREFDRGSWKPAATPSSTRTSSGNLEELSGDAECKTFRKMLVQTHTPGSNEMLSNVENRWSIDGPSEMSAILCRDINSRNQNEETTAQRQRSGAQQRGPFRGWAGEAHHRQSRSSCKIVGECPIFSKSRKHGFGAVFFGEAECCARRAAVSEAVIRAVPMFAGFQVKLQFLKESAALRICKRDRVERVRY